jgi:hypothetical protein
MRTTFLTTLLLAALFLGGIRAAGGDAQLPKGWFASGMDVGDYELGADNTVRHGGKASGTIKAKADDPKGFATLMQTFKADDYRGKRLRLSGHVKTDKVGNWAGLWMRIDSETKMVAFDNMQNRKIQGTNDWKKYELVLDVPKEALNISFGLLSAGKGQAWADDFQFEVVGKDVSTTQIEVPERDYPEKVKSSKNEKPQNLDFEK